MSGFPAQPPSDYDRAVERWGPDPERWPTWVCTACPQFHSGWSLECGRCGRPREEVDGMIAPRP